jgi:NADPH:quinone reductase-like Zn-dependent oxidoreductase
VQIAAAPVNPSDLMFVRGTYGIRKTLPTIPGFEGSGTVVAHGGDPWGRALMGARVACGTPGGDGTWAEYVLVPAQACLPLLPHVDSARGAMLIVNPLTAWALVDTSRRYGHRAIVQTAAASQLGRMVLKICRRSGIPLINIVRRKEQANLLRTLGARHVLDSTQPDFEEQLRRLCISLDATVALDAVGGELTTRLLRIMPDSSRFIIYGALSDAPFSISPYDPLFRRTIIEGFWLTDWIARVGLTGVIQAGLDLQTRLLECLDTTIQARMPLEDAVAGIGCYEANMTAGKLLIVPNQSR